MREDLILMGVIGRPHGVQGLVRVSAFTQSPEALAEYPLRDRAGRRFALEWRHDNVAQISEITPQGQRRITDRDEAARLNLTELFVPRAALPAPEPEEFYLADLIGLTAMSEAGEELGIITAVHDYGGGSTLEISPGARLVPFTQAAVPVVDLAQRRVVIRPPAEITGASA